MADRDENGHMLPGNSVGKSTRFKSSGNPGGMWKTRREIVTLARDSMPKAIARARQILDDDKAEPRMWLEAGKFVLSCSAIGEKPGPKGEEERSGDVLDELTPEEVRALARQSLAAEPDEDAGDDDSDETEH